jgi:hypothetical protein
VSREREMDQALDSNGPGSRRFRHLIERERRDMGWLVHVVACMYDEISGGRISKPTTYPHEVIREYEDRLNEACEEAMAEERVRISEAVEGLAEKLGRRYQAVGQDWAIPVDRLPVAAIIAIINDKEVSDENASGSGS